MKTPVPILLLLFALWMTCCSSTDDSIDPNIGMEKEEMQETTEGVAQVTDVSVSGEENQYTFSVTISSPDLGCRQYADWWEIIDLDGNLIYRRILAHSHVNEQPFTRSGASIDIDSETVIYIRAHMNTTSYGSKVFKGSISAGFIAAQLDSEFAEGLTEVNPLPDKCAF